MPRRSRNRAALAALFLSAGLSVPLASHAQYKTIETENMRLVYHDPLYTYLAPHLARCFEANMQFHRALFHYTPSEKVTVIMSDLADYGNAGANSIPRNAMLVDIAPMNRAYETTSVNERLHSLMAHELLHVVALDQATGSDAFFRKLFFGKVNTTAKHPESILFNYLTSPRRSSPRWYHEGMAVFFETWMSGGLGRAQGPYDEMVFRSMVLDDSHFYDPIGLQSEGTKVDFQVGVNAYLYGTRFVNYLAYEYEPEKLVTWLSRTPGTKKYFASNFRNVYGLSLDEAWNDWIAFEHEFQRTNLDSIQQYPVTPFHDLSPKALGSISRAFYDAKRNRIYVGVNYPGEIAHIAAIPTDGGPIEKVCDVKGPALYFVTSLVYDDSTDTVVYTTDNNDWRDLVAVNVETGDRRMLMKDVRIGDLALNPVDRSIWGVRHYNGLTTIVRIPPPYDEWYQVYTLPYGKVIYDIDVSPDGKLLSASLGEVSGRQTLTLYSIEELLAGSQEHRTLYDFQNSMPTGFVFTQDSGGLYGSSYSTGASNIWHYDLAADSISCVSNCETGFFRPVPLAPDSLIVFRYTGDGFVPSMIDPVPLEDVSAIQWLGNSVIEKHPVVGTWLPQPPRSINLDSLTVYEGSYRSWSSIGLASAHPVAEGYKDYPAYGMALNLSDPLSYHKATLSVTYSPNTRIPSDERLHVKANYDRYDFNASYTYNRADFYDLFGPTKVSRKGHSVGAHYKRNLVWDTPKKMDLSIGATGFFEMEALPRYQNVSQTFDQMLALDASLSYTNLRFSLGAAEYEKGTTGNLSSYVQFVNEDVFPSMVGEFDLGFPFLFNHSSMWIRTATGVSGGDRQDSFSNFFFGGFGNNYVDHRSIQRYREYYSFPGLELNQAGGTNFGKVLLDWNLPPIRFRRVGTQAFYLTWIRASLFTTGLATNIDDAVDAPRVLFGNVGGQVDLRFTLMSHLNMTLSAGYAVAAPENGRSTDEVMVSLKIL